ncbi:uncharacterized protein SPSK_01904 [Sporothrix schenckii 1099-18]|uniref:DUF8021 domain-containing protein n=1 Tax=Sporothrix schenckii 1099-18 TaxID=1397361 RepID=A0A0F2MH56_SPOSC|nr:uncharacterized protein SPSK_01904 [Sporothrix schenckii 1099-18]KJR87491.1 hypothetical protein SPSK_01904 [Sporothrix schenckii 1099-18]
MAFTLSLLALTGLVVQGAVAANCTRDVLAAAASAYLAGAAAGKPPANVALTNFTYEENDVPLDIGKGILARPISIDFNRTFLDTEACGAFIEYNAASNTPPYVVIARVYVAPGSSSGNSSGTPQITRIASVVTKPGDWAFNAATQLAADKKEAWPAIPAGQQDTRAVLKAAADAYLDSWGNTTLAPPFGTTCSRIEGGTTTGQTGNTCKMQPFPSPLTIGNRRYIIDPEYGAVDIFNNFPFIDTAKPDGTPSTNLYRIEGGKIRYIHELTVCTNKNCGR